MEPVFARKLLFYYQQNNGPYLRTYDHVQDQNSPPTTDYPSQRPAQHIQEWLKHTHTCKKAWMSTVSGALWLHTDPVLYKSRIDGTEGYRRGRPTLYSTNCCGVILFFFLLLCEYYCDSVKGCGLRLGVRGERRATETGSTSAGAQEEWPRDKHWYVRQIRMRMKALADAQVTESLLGTFAITVVVLLFKSAATAVDFNNK